MDGWGNEWIETLSTDIWMYEWTENVFENVIWKITAIFVSASMC